MLRSILTFLRRYWRWFVALQVVVLGVWILSQGITAEGQVKVRAEKFRQALASKNPTLAWKMVSANYRDEWGMARDDLGLAMKDVTSQFLALNVEWVDPRFEVRDRAVFVTARPQLSGRSLTPAGEIILATAARLREPFVFRWEKEGWGPWTWRLTSISCPGLEIPAGYRAGMLSEKPASLDEFFGR